MKETQTADIIPALRAIEAFRNLEDELLQSIATFFSKMDLDKDSIIFSERDLPADYGNKLHFLAKGAVKLVKYASNGENTIVRLVSAGDFFGATGVLTNQAMPFSAETLTAATVLTVERPLFESLVERHPAIALRMIAQLGQVLWFNYTIHSQVIRKTDVRICKIILYHLRHEGYQETDEGLLLNVSLPHDYLASMTGIAYEESVRIISRLKKQYGCINYMRGGKIVITDLPRLRQIALEEEDKDG